MTTVPLTSTQPPSALGYQRALDGMRAIAIGLVLLFHYPFVTKSGQLAIFAEAPVHGGFLGVDVFFVLSGFLITTLLLEESARHGIISLRSFYARRALRLLPAFFVLFVFAVGCYVLLGANDAVRPSGAGLIGMLFYLANWVQIWSRGSLGGVFGHTWSLAIEEQFYVVFPVIALIALGTRARRATLAIVVALGAAGAALWRAIYWEHTHANASFIDYYANITGRSRPQTNPVHLWDRWYFGTDMRADALLVGCLAAIALSSVRPRLTRGGSIALQVAGALAFAGAGFVIFKAVVVESAWLPLWGLLVLELCVALATVSFVIASPANPLAWLLSLPPLVWIGRRSYAIYLFHTSVLYLLPRRRTHLPPPLQLVFTFIVIGLLAEASWRFVEQPFLRRKRRFERRADPTLRPLSTAAVPK
jgi:peptidoglycan/LPS O-acetylase OafA/YrhL